MLHTHTRFVGGLNRSLCKQSQAYLLWQWCRVHIPVEELGANQKSLPPRWSKYLSLVTLIEVLPYGL